MKAFYSLTLLVALLYGVNGVDYADSCKCSMELTPKLKGIYDDLLVISRILEMAQTKAAVLAYTARRNMSNHVIETAVPLSAESALCSNGDGFLSRMSFMLPTVKSLETSISIMAKRILNSSDESSSPEHPNHDNALAQMETVCPSEITSDIYMNLSSQVTDAAHFMSEVESNEVMAVNNLLCIRLMVVEMYNQTEKYQGMLKHLETLPCERSAIGENTHARASESSDADKSFFDCVCVKEVLPIVTKLVDELQWLLPLIKEIETYCLLASSTTASARLAPGKNHRTSENIFGIFSTRGDYNESFFGVNFVASFPNNPAAPVTSRGRSTLNSFQSCPAQDFNEKFKSAQEDVKNAIYLREDVKRDQAHASQILPNITSAVVQVEEQINKYSAFKINLDTYKC